MKLQAAGESGVAHFAPNVVKATLIVVLASAACGCSRPDVPPAPVAAVDATFRVRDAALLEAFAGLTDGCASRWTERDCLARLRHLRAEELQLFAEVRAHRFAEITESNYWHRGRLKFPGEIEQTLDRIERR